MRKRTPPAAAGCRIEITGNLAPSAKKLGRVKQRQRPVTSDPDRPIWNLPGALKEDLGGTDGEDAGKGPAGKRTRPLDGTSCQDKRLRLELKRVPVPAHEGMETRLKLPQ